MFADSKNVAQVQTADFIFSYMKQFAAKYFWYIKYDVSVFHTYVFKSKIS